MRQPGEPSIEEILESIKRVIAREDRGVAQGGGRQPGDILPEPDDGETSEGDPVGTSPAPALAPLIAEHASISMRASLETLANVASKAGSQSSDIPTGGSAAERLLEELLRPAIAEWLDRNLPGIVERMVAAEIARITRRN